MKWAISSLNRARELNRNKHQPRPEERRRKTASLRTATSVDLQQTPASPTAQPIRGLAPERVAVGRTEKAEMPDRTLAERARIDLLAFRLRAGEAGEQKIDRRRRRPGIVVDTDRAQRPAIARKVCKLGERRIIDAGEKFCMRFPDDRVCHPPKDLRRPIKPGNLLNVAIRSR
jgi:hypothetical protein